MSKKRLRQRDAAQTANLLPQKLISPQAETFIEQSLDGQSAKSPVVVVVGEASVVKEIFAFMRGK